MKEEIKIKPLTEPQISISLDRLTRFKPTEEKYLRVFCDILNSNLISPKFSKKQLADMDYGQITKLVEAVFEKSLCKLRIEKTDDFSINKRLLEYEKSIFKFDRNVERLLDNKIDYSALKDFMSERKQIRKIVIVEGLTEEILLPKFAELSGVEFAETGIHVISAGGKNQVVKLFYKYAEVLKLPIFVLLDADAVENCEQIKLKVRKNDSVYVLECGEFEDVLPLNLIKRVLNKKIEYPKVKISDLRRNLPMTQILHEICHERGLEFKKSEFALNVAQCVSRKDISNQIAELISQMVS